MKKRHIPLTAVLAASAVLVSCEKYAPGMQAAAETKSVYPSAATSSSATPAEKLPEVKAPETSKPVTAPMPKPAAVPVAPPAAAPLAPPPVPAPAPAPAAVATSAVTAPAPAAITSGGINIKPEMPKPLFAGTPLPDNSPPPNLEKPGNPILEYKVPEGVALLSKGKPVTSSDTAPLPSGSAESLALITDGEKQGDDGYFADLLPGKQWVQIDLGESKEIHLLWLWHFHKQAVIYKDVIATVSDDPTGAKSTVVFNNDFDNSEGLGEGKDVSWIETNNGRAIPVSGVKGRYVRFYTSGRNIDDTNQYIEVEVYGK